MLRPNVEPATYVPMPSDVGLQAGGSVHKASRVRETRHWFFVGCDDARWDWIYATLSGTCLRTGQLAMQTLHDEVIQKGVTHSSHRTDLGPCWTARAAWHTGNTHLQHGMTAHDTFSAGYISDYNDNYVTGHKTTRAHATALQWQGPWGKDLAFQAGYGRQRVTHAQQLTDGTPRTVSQAVTGASWSAGVVTVFYATGGVIGAGSAQVGDQITISGMTPSGYNGTFPIASIPLAGRYTYALASNPGTATVLGTMTLQDREDDLQAFTGSYFQQLSREGIPVAFMGKITNSRDRADPVPAGIDYCAIQLEDGPNSPVTDNAQYNLWIQEFTMNDGFVGGSNNLNPWDGDGYTNTSYTFSAYQARAISGITWSANVATVTCVNAPGLSAGDQVTIGSNTNGYNGTYTVISGGNPFTISTTNSTGGGGGSAFNRELYGPFLYWNKTKAWLDQLDDSQPFFVNITSRLPHDNNGGYDASTSEKEYIATVAESDAVYFNGVAGAKSPVTSSVSASAKTAFRDSMQMMASLDDMLARLVAYANGRYGTDGWGIIFSSDQGINNTEQGNSYVNADGQTVPAWGDGGGKTFIWDGSARAPFYIRGPKFGDGNSASTVSQPTHHADLGPTLLDLFDITDHHWLTLSGDNTLPGTRDGRSLLRVTDGSDIAHDRMLPIFGDFKTGSGGGNRGWGIVAWKDSNDGGDEKVRKFIELNNTKSSGKWVFPDPNVGSVTYNSVSYLPAYEQEQIVPTAGDLTTWDNALDAALAFRFDPTNETNPAHTTQSP